MRGILLLCAALIVGCAEFQTLEELELAALQSGDWSAVEQRERVMKRRAARRAADCGSGRILVCENYATSKRCSCSSHDDVRALLEGVW